MYKDYYYYGITLFYYNIITVFVYFKSRNNTKIIILFLFFAIVLVYYNNNIQCSDWLRVAHNRTTILPILDVPILIMTKKKKQIPIPFMDQDSNFSNLKIKALIFYTRMTVN